MTDLTETYRRAMARLASGVCVVTARVGSLDLAMTATSVVSVSLEPPTVLFCVHSDARLAEAVQERGRWAISILSDRALADADWLASPGRPALGQLARIPHRIGEHSGAALLDHAVAWIECATQWTKPAGSHEVVVGHVLGVSVAPSATGAILHQHGRLHRLNRPV